MFVPMTTVVTVSTFLAVAAAKIGKYIKSNVAIMLYMPKNETYNT